MPNGDKAKFPIFPTEFTEKEQERLAKITEQRKTLEEIYRGKFTPRAWGEVSLPERAVRELLPSWLSPVVRVLTPWEQGTWDYGFTPERAQEYRFDLEEEYKELVRQEKVTRLLPDIQADLMMAALSGEPITDLTELLSDFPELRTDFTEEEVGYLSALAQNLLHATAEDILSGKAFDYDPTQLPITAGDIEAFAKEVPEIPPRYILSTVAFSKNIQEVGDALQQAFPPVTEEAEVKIAADTRQRLLDYFRQRNIDLGITPEEGEPIKETIKKKHEKIAEEEGELLTLKEEETGRLIVVRKKADNTVWFEDELLGYYDEKTRRIVPFDLGTGQPLLTEEAQESVLKDLWDSFYLGAMQAWYGTRQALFSVIPDAFWALEKRMTEVAPLSPETREGMLKDIQSYRAVLRGWSDQREVEYQEWLKEHPELLPKPEYAQSPIEHTELLKDPNYYAYVIVSNAPIIGAALVSGIVTSIATGNPLVGAVAGAAVITPTQINEVYEDLIANGASRDNATELAASVGTLIGAVEVLPGMIVLKAVSPAFMRIFRGELQRELTTQVVKSLGVRGILTTATKIEIAETLEEVIQQAMQNAAVKTVNENRSIVEGLPEVAINTLIAVSPLAIFGGGAQYMGMKSHLPPKMQDEIDTTAKELVDKGLTPDHAEAVAFTKVTETEKGQAEVELAVEKFQKEIPVPEKVAAKLEWLEKTLETVTSDVEIFTTSVFAQKGRLAKMKVTGELPSEQMAQLGKINDMEESLADLEKRRVGLVKQIDKLKKVKAPEIGITLSLDEISGYETRIPLDLIRKDEKNTLARLTKEIKEKGITEPITIRIREDGSRIVWDGIHRLIVAQGLKIANVPVEYIGVQPTTEPVAMPEELVVPDPDAGRPQTPDKRPRLKDWVDDQEDTNEAVKGNRAIASRIVLDKTIQKARAEAERNLEGLHSRLEEAGENEEAVKIVTDDFGALAKRSDITKKRLLVSHWNDLTPPEQASLALATIPDKSMTFSVKKEVFDIRYYMQLLEEMTGLPFYTIFKRVELSHGAGRIAQEKILLRIGADPNFTHIRTDEAALARVAQEINARNPRLHIDHPENLPDQELLLANVVEEMYKYYEPMVRYLRFMRVAPNMDSMKDAFPDAVEAGREIELALALGLRNRGELDGLYSLLATCDWGVIGSGYDPFIVSHPTLVPTRVSLGTTRGAARLMRRESVEFPEGMEKNVLLRLATYSKQIEAQWRIEPELDALEHLWVQAGDKMTNPGQVESALREWSRELQGIPTRQSFFDSVIRRVWRQAMSAVFLHPWMAYRNVHQPLAFHPDRSELFRLVFQKPSPSVQEKGRIYYDSFVSQLKGIRRDWLYMGERGLPLLGWITRLSDRLSLYSHSDNIPRRWSFEASVNKAMRATEGYRKDGDVGKWLKNSGANHLRQTERNYALQLLAQPTFDLAVPGLREVNGDEMASLYIGHEVANMTHFIYERAFRAPVEMGATGRTIFNLIVFPRGYFQRVYFQAQKLPNLKEVFSPEVNWEQARAGFRDLVLLTIVGMMVSEWIRKVTGRPRRSYNPADIIQWQLGGLVIGVGMDLTKLIGDIITALDPTVDPEHKRDVLARIPGELIRMTDVLVPFYRSLIDSIEASTDTANIDVHFLRQLRAMIDDKYTPEEVEEIDRKLWEKVRKAVLAGEPPDPTMFQSIQEALIENQARLGEMDAEGRFYTLRQFAGDIKTLTKPLPDDMLTEDYNFSDLVIFYKECEDNWGELYKIKSSPASLRKEWRENNVEVEAMLLFWGMYSASVFTRGSPEWIEVSELLQIWFDLYGIDQRMHGEWADWTLPTR